MKQSNPNITQRIKSIVESYDPDAKVYLYGSRARSESKKNSDWDILILLSDDEITPEIERKVTSPIYDLEFDTGEIISPSVYSEKEWKSKFHVTPYFHNIMNEGILL